MFGQKARGNMPSENEGRADLPLEEAILDDEAPAAAADNDMAASNSQSYIDDDEENTIRSPSRAKGSLLWLQSSSDSNHKVPATIRSKRLFCIHLLLVNSTSAAVVAENSEVSLTPAREVKKLSI